MVLLSADPSSSRQVSDNYDDILSHLVTSDNDGHLHWSQPPIWPEDELTSFNKGPSIGSVLRAARPWRPIEANVDDIVPAEELLDDEITADELHETLEEVIEARDARRAEEEELEAIAYRSALDLAPATTPRMARDSPLLPFIAPKPVTSLQIINPDSLTPVEPTSPPPSSPRHSARRRHRGPGYSATTQLSDERKDRRVADTRWLSQSVGVPPPASYLPHNAANTPRSARERFVWTIEEPRKLVDIEGHTRRPRLLHGKTSWRLYSWPQDDPVIISPWGGVMRETPSGLKQRRKVAPIIEPPLPPLVFSSGERTGMPRKDMPPVS